MSAELVAEARRQARTLAVLDWQTGALVTRLADELEKTTEQLGQAYRRALSVAEEYDFIGYAIDALRDLAGVQGDTEK